MPTNSRQCALAGCNLVVPPRRKFCSLKHSKEGLRASRAESARAIQPKGVATMKALRSADKDFDRRRARKTVATRDERDPTWRLRQRVLFSSSPFAGKETIGRFNLMLARAKTPTEVRALAKHAPSGKGRQAAEAKLDKTPGRQTKDEDLRRRRAQFEQMIERGVPQKLIAMELHITDRAVRKAAKALRSERDLINVPATGERNPHARLTARQVQEIRGRYVAQEREDGLLRSLGRQYGVTKQAIWRVVTRRTWQGV